MLVPALPLVQSALLKAVQAKSPQPLPVQNLYHADSNAKPFLDIHAPVTLLLGIVRRNDELADVLDNLSCGLRPASRWPDDCIAQRGEEDDGIVFVDGAVDFLAVVLFHAFVALRLLAGLAVDVVLRDVAEGFSQWIDDHLHVHFQAVDCFFLARHHFHGETVAAASSRDVLQSCSSEHLHDPAVAEAHEVDRVVEQVGGLDHLVGGRVGDIVVDVVEPLGCAAAGGDDAVVASGGRDVLHQGSRSEAGRKLVVAQVQNAAEDVDGIPIIVGQVESLGWTVGCVVHDGAIEKLLEAGRADAERVAGDADADAAQGQ